MPTERSLSYRPSPAPQSTAVACDRGALAIFHHTSSPFVSRPKELPLQVVHSLRDIVFGDNGLVSVSSEMCLGSDVFHDRPLCIPNLITVDTTGG